MTDVPALAPQQHIALPEVTLVTERLVLRTPKSADWHAFATFFASERARFVGGPADAAQGWRALGHIIGHWVLRGFGSFIVTPKGEDRAIGASGPWQPINWPEQEIAWTIWDPAVEGRGIAREAAIATRAYAYRVLGWTSAVSYVDPENHRSAALAERLGCTVDPDGQTPFDEPCLVYRHPSPAELAA
ncbi:MAG: GNAT family N-acetyltransferase [Pseudomonadota bacterium]